MKDNEYGNKSEITSNEIMGTKLMLLKEGHCLKDQILEVCKLTDQNSNHGFSAASLNTLVQMVQGNLGSTLIPAMAKDQLIGNNKKLTAVHLNEPSPHRRIAFIFRPNYSRLSSIECLASICKQSLAEQCE